MFSSLSDPRILKVLSLDGTDTAWHSDLERLQANDDSLTRESAAEGAVEAIQRLLIFLGYSTTASGAFTIDGDFGRGTNRGLAQFQFDNGLTEKIKRSHLAYPCSFQTVRKEIDAIPDIDVDLQTLDIMLETARRAIDEARVPLGRFNDALFHLNSLHEGKLLKCNEILDQYGDHVAWAAERVRADEGVDIQPEWVLAIIRQESAGVVRPRFEQHKLSKFAREEPGADMAELRIRSMSIGLGQIMGFNARLVGAPSAQAMLYSPVPEQVLYVARFLLPKATIVSKSNPTKDDFRTLARFYNGPKFEAHEYDLKLKRWFREFRRLRVS